MNKKICTVILLMLMCALFGFAQAAGNSSQGAGSGMGQGSTPPAPPSSISGVLNARLKGIESEFVSAADAMPEDKYSFAPTNGEFKGVRTFARQVRHVAATNWEVAAGVLGEKPPVDTKGPNDNGPEAIKTKADIMKYLKDSFAYVHKAVDQITPENAVAQINSPFDPSGKAKTTRLGMAVLLFGHGFDHYGQMVEYLRMNGIIPPASRGQ
jgi:DinB superfamily